VAALCELAGGARAAPLWLFGPAGSGKSHLLQAACAHATTTGLTAAWLPLRAMREEGPALLAGFESLDLVALDDIDAIAGDAGWERGLFTFYNELLERQGRLAATAAAAPAAMPFGLPDLASRLAAARIYRLLPLDETDQAEALRRRAEYRGLELPEETLQFLTRRAPRDFAALCGLLDALDLESLAARRRLTVPFVRDWLSRERD
jgi:DnaA family protein